MTDLQPNSTLETREQVKSTRVALVKGKERLENTGKALSLIEDDIDLTGKESIFVKPNFVTTGKQLAATHRDAIKAVLEFLRERTSKPITIGEGAAVGNTFDGYSGYGYLELARKYNVTLVDNADDEFVKVKAYDSSFGAMYLHLARRVVESDFRISVCPLKTHNMVIVTLSLKNIVVGSLRDKSQIHQGYPGINLNIFRMARYVSPHLSVIDGFTGMEGDGPVSGSEVKPGVAIASTDFLAADTVAAKIMGFDIDKIGYLYYCKIKGLGTGDIDSMNIVGENIDSCIQPFEPHPDYKSQLDWHIPDLKNMLDD